VARAVRRLLAAQRGAIQALMQRIIILGRDTDLTFVESRAEPFTVCRNQAHSNKLESLEMGIYVTQVTPTYCGFRNRVLPHI
jgi:hypothetical protein